MVKQVNIFSIINIMALFFYNSSACPLKENKNDTCYTPTSKKKKTKSLDKDPSRHY